MVRKRSGKTAEREESMNRKVRHFRWTPTCTRELRLLLALNRQHSGHRVPQGERLTHGTVRKQKSGFQ